MSQYRVYRHHRLNADETPWVFTLVHNRLWDLYRQRGDPEEAGALVKVFHRFMTNKVGPPAYPRVWEEDEDGRPVLNWSLMYAQLLEWSREMEADAGNVTMREAGP